LPDAGEVVGEDVPAEEEARELVAEEAASAEDEAGESEVEAAEPDLEVAEEAGQSGGEQALSDVPEASGESVEELADEGQTFEAEVVEGVENAPPADAAEPTIHERVETPNENVPEEEEPGEKRS
ncbi:MAG TPA: hypothetical protein VKV05_06060, partial [Terriglobales bacterium]|nr:hypothetical protein [Terriglobales bacterium]